MTFLRTVLRIDSVDCAEVDNTIKVDSTISLLLNSEYDIAPDDLDLDYS